ncbi:HAMP domain-containing sensor histidine kinase [Fusibacter sp. 3D3]|uniref:HAMP domain-containing sensor histidine kinase n=1 Tax=Fusibacter sp. 3D3 TaxID=1048380 RepID=UPI000853A7C8|nr:HAMP domain-containing sensor histidine kinase [Fusibacter sp. 3D3]GAU79078.1 osmosensitive K+ channel histidine kinase KdpD [Fusibacter sp. 3D3]
MNFKNRKSINFKMWLYFTAFSIFIVAMLWIFQIVFLNSFFESMKKQNISKLADSIISEYGAEDFQTTIDDISFKNSILIYITTDAGEVLFTSDEHSAGGLWRQPNDTSDPPPDSPPSNPPNNALENPADNPFDQVRPLPRDYDDFLNRLKLSEKERIAYTMAQEKFDGDTFIYGVKFEAIVLYMSSPMPPVDATIVILKKQLIYVTFGALICSLFVGYFISKKVAKPILEINEKSKFLSKGEYALSFTKGSYSEIDELATTLEEAGVELSKIEGLRQELIANISHDFRTPLTMIKAYAEMIRDISGNQPVKREKHLKVIVDEADRLAELVNDILDLSSLQSRTAPLNKAYFSLSALLKETVSRFELLSEHEPYFIETYIEESLFINADRTHIERVLYNLIGNAINYTDESGKIHIKLFMKNQSIRFEVKDNGVGIFDEDLPHIWDRYYKSRTPSDKIKSTGLGLSIVKQILELHHATFSVESIPKQGSTFWFELPFENKWTDNEFA